MSDALKELLWMVGCTSVMVAVGLVALVGYLKLQRAVSRTRVPESEELVP